MTTKEIAETAGKDERTIQRWVKKLSDKMPSVGVKLSSSNSMNPANYDLQETCAIIEMGLGKNAADLFRMSAKEKPSTESRIDRLESLMEKMLVAVGNMMMLQGQSAQQKPPAIEAPKLNPREELRMIVNKAASESHDYSGTWKTLYQEIYYRLHINAQERARNSKTSAIDILEAEGLLENSVAIAREIFR